MPDFLSFSAQHLPSFLSQTITRKYQRNSAYCPVQKVTDAPFWFYHESKPCSISHFLLVASYGGAPWWQLCLILLVPGSGGHFWICRGSQLPSHHHCWHTSLNKFLIILPEMPLFTGLDPDKHLFIEEAETLPPPTICRLSCHVLASHRCRGQCLLSQLWL